MDIGTPCSAPDAPEAPLHRSNVWAGSRKRSSSGVPCRRWPGTAHADDSDPTLGHIRTATGEGHRRLPVMVETLAGESVQDCSRC